MDSTGPRFRTSGNRVRRPAHRRDRSRIGETKTTDLDPVPGVADGSDMTETHRIQMLRFGTGICGLGLVLAFGRVLQPRNIEAAAHRREVVEDFASRAPSLGTLHGRDHAVRILVGPDGPRFQVLDEDGLVRGVYDSPQEMATALERLGRAELRAEVSDLLLPDS